MTPQRGWDTEAVERNEEVVRETIAAWTGDDVRAEFEAE